MPVDISVPLNELGFSTAGVLAQTEGRNNFRNLFHELYQQRTSRSRFAVACHGDSVSHRVWQFIVQELRRYYGDGGIVGPVQSTLTGAFTATWTGTVAHDLSAAGAATGDYQYLPNGGHFIMSSGAVLTMTAGNKSTFSRVITWFARRPGDGSALVELIDNTSVVLASSTIVLDGVNGTLERVVFDGIDVTKQISIRITATGSVVVLTGAFLRDYGVIAWATGRGSTNLTQQNQSNIAILSGILSDINAVLMVHEYKEEDASNTFAPMMARMAQMPSVDQLFIGTLPDSGSDSVRKDNNKLLRTNALANGFAYFDGDMACKDYDEIVRLGWQGDGTHLDSAAYFFVAQLVMTDLHTNLLGSLLSSPLIVADSFSVARNDGYGLSVPFTDWSSSDKPERIGLTNIKKVAMHGGPSLEPYSNYGVIAKNSSGSRGVFLAAELDLTPGKKATVTGGAASALPSQPVTYIAISVDGIVRYIPVYAA